MCVWTLALLDSALKIFFVLTVVVKTKNISSTESQRGLVWTQTGMKITGSYYRQSYMTTEKVSFLTKNLKKYKETKKMKGNNKMTELIKSRQ